MNKKINIRQIGLQAIENEYSAIKDLVNSIDENFESAVEKIFSSEGRIVVSGVGKSAIIAQKIVATFNSTGTPSIFMHAADAIHGDLGIVQSDDIVIIISKSGESPEIKALVPLLKARKNLLIAMAGNSKSYLARQADILLDTTVNKEACPNNLAPTSSTTAQMVMGDALAICLLELRGFSPSDFAKFHPGGALGKRMYFRVSDLAGNNQIPQVDINEKISKVIMEISSKRLGSTAVLENNRLVGVITDGDLRRMIEKNPEFLHLTAREVMTKTPRTINKNEMVVEALSIMRENNITQLLVVDGDTYLGIIHLHDILKEGIF